MKLVIEHTDHGFYAYFETEKHHRLVEENPEGRFTRKRVPARRLSEECYLPTALQVGEYMVVEVKRR